MYSIWIPLIIIIFWISYFGLYSCFHLFLLQLELSGKYLLYFDINWRKICATLHSKKLSLNSEFPHTMPTLFSLTLSVFANMIVKYVSHCCFDLYLFCFWWVDYSQVWGYSHLFCQCLSLGPFFSKVVHFTQNTGN